MSDETTTEQLAEIEGQADTPATEYTPPEGWRLVRFGELLLPGDEIVQIDDGRRYPTHRIGDAVGPNQQYIRRIGPQPGPEQAAIELLRSEVSYVQNLLGESRQRVAQLEELVTSLRTINEAQERAFSAANKANDDLEHRLNVVAAELVTQFETSRQLQADLEQVTRERDQYLDSYQRIFGDLETIRETTKAEAVEAIVEWLEPVRAAIAAPDNVDESTRAGWFAEEVIQHLPSIMRHLTGLDSPEDVD